MEMMEKIAVGGLSEAFKRDCPFIIDCEEVNSTEAENIRNDDQLAVQRVQKNNGGTLGKNLEKGSRGSEGTTNKVFEAPEYSETRFDTKVTGKKIEVKTPQGMACNRKGPYPFGMAAHHLIPGNASLKRSKIIDYMTEGKSVKDTKGKSLKIMAHIGYNVNGSHNGVWLPGNYALRALTSPTGKTWRKLVVSHEDWCLNYVAAVIKKTGRQFHDVHTEYSDEVKALLNKIATRFQRHSCDDCKNKTEIAPPYVVKLRLYNISRKLRTKLSQSNPGLWKLPWVTSDKWKSEIVVNRKKFTEAYKNAKP